MPISSRIRGAVVAIVADGATTLALPAVAPAKTRTITCSLKLFATIPQPALVTTLAPPVPPATLPTIAGVVYTGTVSVTGGTGAWRRIRGSGTVTGTSPDAKVTSLTEKLTLRGFR